MGGAKACYGQAQTKQQATALGLSFAWAGRPKRPPTPIPGQDFPAGPLEEYCSQMHNPTTASLSTQPKARVPLDLGAGDPDTGSTGH